MIFFFTFNIGQPCKHYNFQTCLRDNLVPRMLEMALQSFQISKFSGGAYPQTPLGHTVGYSSLTSCLLQILLKPLSSSKTNWNQSCLAFTYFPALCIGLSHLICLIEFWSIGLLDCVWFNLWLGRVSTLVLFLWHYWKLLLHVNHIDEFLYLILAKYKQSTK